MEQQRVIATDHGQMLKKGKWQEQVSQSASTLWMV